ncbi:hypothetical protein C8R44DRAFT_608632, partial [Mycena epipterygia]
LQALLGIPPGIRADLNAIAEQPHGQRPTLGLSCLAQLAINGSREKTLTTQGVCKALINRFVWYKVHEHDKSWKASKCDSES